MGDFLRAEVAAGRGYLPAGADVLRAFTRPLADVRVLIVGQDPYPTPGPRDGPVVLGAPRRASAATEPAEHLSGAARRPRRRTAARRGPDSLGRPGGAAAQPGPHRVSEGTRQPPWSWLGGGHRLRDPCRGGTPHHWWPCSGAGTRRPPPRCSARFLASRACTRARCPPTAASSGPGRSAGSTRSWPPQALNPSTGPCRPEVVSVTRRCRPRSPGTSRRSTPRPRPRSAGPVLGARGSAGARLHRGCRSPGACHPGGP